MSRGIVAGVIWGTVLGGLGLAAASQMAEPPGRIATLLAPVAEPVAVAVPEPVPVPAPVPVPVPEPEPVREVPFEIYARAFQNPDAKPLFAVVLRDTGPGTDRVALAALPFAVTFAIDPLASDAAEAMRAYRAAGQEVMILATGMSAASSPDAILAAHLAVLPETVALMDPEGGFQGDQGFAARTVAALRDQGRGLLTWNHGQNLADQIARRDGVPAARIFRQLDTGAEDASVIRSYLDRAAFRAAQDGSVVVMGDTRAQTVQGLADWAAVQAAVALAPISAVMGAR